MKVIIIICIVRGFLLAGVEVNELGRFGGTGTAPGMFNNPSAIDITEDGRVIVCDRGNHRVQVFDLRGRFLTNFGGFGAGAEMFDEPVDIWARSTINIFVSDLNNQRVKRYNKDLTLISTKYSNPGDDERFRFEWVRSSAYSPQGDLFVLDAGAEKVIKFNSGGQGDVAFGYYESGSGELTSPIQIDLTTNHRVLVSDAGSRSVFIFDYFGNFLSALEYPDFHTPSGIATDDLNRIYVADPDARALFIFSAAGAFISVIKNIGGMPLDRPKDMAVYRDKDNFNMYVIDGDQVVITALKFNPTKE